MACWAWRVSRATLASRRSAYHDELRMFSRSNRARNSGARQVPALTGGAVDHDLQQGPQRRHGPLDGAVGPVVLGHHLVGGDDDVHRVGEDRLVLQLGTQHLLGEDDVGVQEDAAEEGRGEGLVHPVAQARGLNGATLVLEVLNVLEVAALDETVGIPLLGAHAGEDLRDEQRDVVGHLNLRADVAGRGQPAVIAAEGVGQQGRVEVVNGRQRVERRLGQRPLTAGAVVEGDLPVMEEMNSMNSSGSSM